MKITIGSAYPVAEEKKAMLRGRDLATGLPATVNISSSEIREAVAPTVRLIIESIKDTVEKTPPELVSDIMDRGIFLAGGGSLLPGLDEVIAKETKIPVNVAQDSLTCVVRGTGKLLEDRNLLERVKVSGG